MKAVRSTKGAGYSGLDETAPRINEMHKFLEEKVLRKFLDVITLKNGRTCTSHPQRSSSLAVRRNMLTRLDGRFSSIRTAVGVHMTVGHSPARNPTVDRSAAHFYYHMASLL